MDFQAGRPAAGHFKLEPLVMKSQFNPIHPPPTKQTLFFILKLKYVTSGIIVSQIRWTWQAALPQLSGQKVTAWIFWVVSCCTVKNK